MARPSGLLLAYDAESGVCCRRIDWYRQRDRWGLLVFFPLQNRELVGLAPELAGRSLHGEIHALDLATRQVWNGGFLVPVVLSRLPVWRWVAPALRFPGISGILAWRMRMDAERHNERFGRQPFQDRF